MVMHGYAHSMDELQMENAHLRQRVEELERREHADAQAIESHVHTLIDHIGAAVFIHHKGEYRYANRAAEDILGYTATEMCSMQFADFIHPDSLALVQERAAARQRGEPVPPRYEVQVVSKQGTVHWIDITNRLVEFMGERVIVVTFFDITARKQVEMQLQEQENWSRQLLMSLFDGIVVLEQGHIIQANQPAANMFGYAMDELIGMSVLDLATPESRDIARQHMVSGSEAMYEATLLRKDGSTFEAEVMGKMVHDRGRSLRIVSARDITERKRAEAERAAMQQQIIEAQRATLHELSAPLLPISDHLVLMPLIGTIDTQRAQMVMEALLEGVARHHASVAILDITGVRMVDTQVAQAFIQVAQAVRLLGARVMLTGIQPQIAQTLVHLGVDLQGIITHGSLQTGIAAALHDRSRKQKTPEFCSRPFPVPNRHTRKD